VKFKTYRCTKWYHPQPCWHSKCLDCGEVIDAFSYSAEESEQIARGRPHHSCPNQQLDLSATKGMRASAQ